MHAYFFGGRYSSLMHGSEASLFSIFKTYPQLIDKNAQVMTMFLILKLIFRSKLRTQMESLGSYASKKIVTKALKCASFVAAQKI